MKRPVPDQDTIAALSSAPGPGAISVIRVSGPDALELASELFRGKQDPRSMKSFTLAHGWIEKNGERIDEVLCLVMRAPGSYTREHVVEFHCHGGPAAARGALEAVLRAGARPAAPGEFTRRAFLAGRLDLAQAEAVADLIASRTAAAARAATMQLEGALSRALHEIRANLAELLARLEAGIDFADEEDVVIMPAQELKDRLSQSRDRLERMLEQAPRGKLLREGARVVIAGRPNVGKSTLMNRLLRADRVIVTPTPGTTRDLIEDAVEIAGLPIRLFDTAGLRESRDPVESAGVERARRALFMADLALLLLDGSEPIGKDDRDLIPQLSGPALLVINKCDLAPKLEPDEARALLPAAPLVKISALTGEGMDRLEQKIAETLMGSDSPEPPLITSARHEDALERTSRELAQAIAAAEREMSDEFIASDLRRALEALGEITGETATEELLDLIFSRFCIGK